MKILQNRIRSHSTIVLCAIFILILATALIVFNQMFGRTLDAIDLQSSHLDSVTCSQIRSELDTVLSSASDLVSMINSNLLVHQFSSIGRPSTANEHYSLYELLMSIGPYRNIVYNNRMILDFAVYYPDSDMLVNMQSYYNKTESYYDHWYLGEEISYEEWLSLISSNFTGCFVSAACTDDTLVYMHSIDVSTTPSANLIIFFDKKELEQMIAGFEQPGIRILLSVDGISLLSSPLPPELEEVFSINPADPPAKVKGWVISELPSNTLRNASYYIAAEDASGSFLPQNSLRRFYSTAITIIIVIAVATLLITLLIILIPFIKREINQRDSTQNISSLSILKESIDSVFSRGQTTSSSNEWLIVKDALLDLLSSPDFSRDETLDTLSKHDIVFKYPYFVIALFTVSGSIPASVFSEIASSCNVKYNGEITNACFPVGNGRFAALFNLFSPDTLYTDAVEHIRSELQSRTDSDVTVFIGSIQEGTANIHQSYNDAAALIEYKIFTGSNAVLDHNAYMHSDTEYYYPMDVELALISAVSSGNSQRVSQLLQKVHEENFVSRQLRPDIAKLLLNELAGTTLKITRGMDEIIQDPASRVLKCTTVEEVFYTLQEIYLKVCEQHQTSSDSRRKEAFQQYILMHYTNPDFSQSSMAEGLNVSQAYLSSQFKQYFNVTMISYVNNLRVEKAAELLSNTDTPVQDIATLCGFSNGDALTRVFKKKYGVTPTDFRNGISVGNGTL